MMIVVLPALSASRTSIHVISSSQIVFGVAIGFFVSEQLYSFPGLARPRPALSVRGTRGHVPAPRLCTPPGAPACDGFCAAAVDSAKTAVQQAIAVFIVFPPPQGDLTSQCQRIRASRTSVPMAGTARPSDELSSQAQRG